MFREKGMTLTKETTKSVNIEITPNVQYCLKLMEMAVKGLPDGDLKSSCEPAIEYLLKTSKGHPQHYHGHDCNYYRVIPTWEITR